MDELGRSIICWETFTNGASVLRIKKGENSVQLFQRVLHKFFVKRNVDLFRGELLQGNTVNNAPHRDLVEGEVALSG